VSSHSTIPALSALVCAHLQSGDLFKRPPQQRKRAEATTSVYLPFLPFMPAAILLYVAALGNMYSVVLF